MKKLLLIGSHSIHTYNYYELVKEYFDEVHVITSKTDFQYDCEVTELSFSIKNIISFIDSIKSIKKITHHFQPTIIHIHQANSIGLIALLATRKVKAPKVLTAWGSDVLITPSNGFFYKRMLKFNLNNANYYTADSEHLAKKMQEYTNKQLNTKIVNFGIDIEEFDCSQKKENIIYSNRLHKPLYRIDKIIIAFNKFISNRKDDNWQLIIGAIGEETNKLKQLVKELNIEDQVKFVGWLEKTENIAHYKKAKLYISIPESDATSTGLLEAMSYGCIPILSDLSSNKEWVDNNRNGIIVSNINSDFISNTENLSYNNIAKKNHNLVVLRANKTNNREVFLSIYRKALSEK